MDGPHHAGRNFGPYAVQVDKQAILVPVSCSLVIQKQTRGEQMMSRPLMALVETGERANREVDG